MAFTDPLSITIGGTTTSLPRVFTQGNKSMYESNDGLILVSPSHTYGTRNRHVIRLEQSKITPNPFIPTQNTEVGLTASVLLDVPKAGFSVAEIVAAWKGLSDMLAASSYGMVTRLAGGES